MRVKTKHLKQEVLRILNEDGISPEELAEKAGINRATVYAILKERYKTTQRAVARKIADGTGRYAEFMGDIVRFHKLPPEIISNFRRNLRHLLQQNPKLNQKICEANKYYIDSLPLILSGEKGITYSQMKEISTAIGYPLELLVQPAPLILPGGKDEERPFVQNYFTAMNHPEDTLRLLLDPYEYQIIQLLRQLPKSDKAKIMDVLKILFEDKLQHPTPPDKEKDRG